MEDGLARLGDELAVAGKAGSGPDDVVGLPMAGRARDIDQRRVLAVDRGGGTVGVGLVLVGVEHLALVAVVAEEDAAVAPPLAVAVGRVGRRPLDVELAVAEGLEGAGIAAAGDALEGAVVHDPFGRAAVHRRPLGGVGAVEEDDGVGGRPAGLLRGAGGAGVDDRRLRAGRGRGRASWGRARPSRAAEKATNPRAERTGSFHGVMGPERAAPSLEFDGINPIPSRGPGRIRPGRRAAPGAWATRRLRLPVACAKILAWLRNFSTRGCA